MPAIQLSVVIITLNEAKNIQRCLDSVTSLADEIIVVDSYSKDNTAQICSQYSKLKFIRNTFEGHIQQKNFALDQASHDFVLSLDADESLSGHLLDEIRKIKDDATSDGYLINRLNVYCGKEIRHCGWYPDRKLRLFNRHKARWGGQNPHDKVIMKEGTKKSALTGDLIHFSFQSIDEHLLQIHKFAAISAHEKFIAGQSTPFLYTLVRVPVSFIKKYILKLGFMDGYYGFVISVLTSYGTFIKDIQLRELHKKNRHD